MTTKPPLHFDLTIRAKNREQLEKIIEYLLNYGYEFTHRQVSDRTGWANEREITIYDFAWGDNLNQMAKILKKEDYID